MSIPKIGIIVERSITCLLKRKTSYRNYITRVEGHEHDISISTIHRVKHSICKTLSASRNKPKTGPYRKTPQKSTIAVIRSVTVIMKKGLPSQKT